MAHIHEWLDRVQEKHHGWDIGSQEDETVITILKRKRPSLFRRILARFGIASPSCFRVIANYREARYEKAGK